MSEENTHDEKKDQADRRKKRLADELRANLMRRKAQTRSRRAGDADERNTGITAGKDETD